MNTTQPIATATASPEITRVELNAITPNAMAMERPQQPIIAAAAALLPLTESSMSDLPGGIGSRLIFGTRQSEVEPWRPSIEAAPFHAVTGTALLAGAYAIWYGRGELGVYDGNLGTDQGSDTDPSESLANKPDPTH